MTDSRANHTRRCGTSTPATDAAIGARAAAKATRPSRFLWPQTRLRAAPATPQGRETPAHHRRTGTSSGSLWMPCGPGFFATHREEWFSWLVHRRRLRVSVRVG